jgi:predicted PurR-regulated permease PerM
MPNLPLRLVLQRSAWLIALVGLIAAIYAIGLSLLPLVLGVIVAYVLHPLPDILERRGLRRAPVVAALVLVVFALLLAVFVLLVPLLVAKIEDFLTLLPQLYDKAAQRFWPSVAPYATLLGFDEAAMRDAATGDIAATIRGWSPTLEQGAVAALDLVLLMALTPFVTYFALRDWHLILRSARALVPRRSEATVVMLAGKIDRRLSGFIRGQTLICIVQGLWHIAGYSLIGLQGAIPLAMGLSNYIPFIGNAIVFVVALGVAATQFDAVWPIAAVVGLYGVSQIVEDGVLYPTIIGDRIKLHPIWVIIVLLTAGGLFGLTGALLAIPIACVVEVLVAYAVDQYRETAFYKER